MPQCSVLLLKPGSRRVQLELLQRALKRPSAALSALCSPCKESGEPPATKRTCKVAFRHIPMGGSERGSSVCSRH